MPGQSRQCKEAIVASRNRCNSGSTVVPAPAVTGGSLPLPTSSFPDLVRLFLSLSEPLAQWYAAIGSLLPAAGVTGAGVLPGPTDPVTSAAPVACSSVMPAPGVSTPAGAQPLQLLRPVDVSVLGSLPAQRGAAGAHLVGRGPFRVGSVAGVGPLPLLALPVRPVYLPSLLLGPWMQKRKLVRYLLPLSG